MKRYLMNQDHWTASQLKGKSFDEIVKLHRYAHKKVDDFIPMHSAEESRRFKRGGLHLESKSSKKQKTNIADQEKQDSSEEQMQHMMQIVPYDDMNAEALQAKYPIIDWEIYTDEFGKYWEIIRCGNRSEVYK